MIVESLTKANSGVACFICAMSSHHDWISWSIGHDILVGGWPTPPKTMKVNGKDDIPYKVKMFQTTKQMISDTVYLVRRYDNHGK